MLKFRIIWWLWISNSELNRRKNEIITLENWKKISSVTKEIVDKYYNVWVREFFLWIIPESWSDNYWYMNSLNWRFWEKEQLEDFEILRQTVDYIHTLDDWKWWKCKALLTVNYRYYTDIKMKAIKEVIDKTKDFMDWFIVWAIEIFEYLKEIWFKWYISLSTILNIYNEYDNRFYMKLLKNYWLNLRRTIFPREVTIKEILYVDKKIVEDNKKLWLNVVSEVFAQWDYCWYANWSCVVWHKMNWWLRDLCSNFIHRGQKVIKSVDYDFLDKLKEDKEIEHELNDIEDIFISSDIMKYINPYLDEVIEKVQLKELEKKDVEKILKNFKIDYLMNKQKYLWDGMTPVTDYHNQFINKVIELLKWIKENYEEKIEKITWIKENFEEILKIKNKAYKHFLRLKNDLWSYWVMVKYKFMLYNRTSLPVLHMLKEMKTLDVLKVPMRWRDANSFKLELDMIQDAVKNPEKYIDEWNIVWRYFHYDITYTDVYKKVLNNIIQN